MVHELKTWIEYFELVMSGEKPFELRKNDRDFLPETGVVIERV